MYYHLYHTHSENVYKMPKFIITSSLDFHALALTFYYYLPTNSGSDVKRVYIAACDSEKNQHRETNNFYANNELSIRHQIMFDFSLSSYLNKFLCFCAKK